MSTYRTKYRGFTIVLLQVNEDRVEYDVIKDSGKPLADDFEGFCVTLDEAVETCKEFINEYLDD